MDEHGKNFLSVVCEMEMGEPRIFVRVYLGVSEPT